MTDAKRQKLNDFLDSLERILTGSSEDVSSSLKALIETAGGEQQLLDPQVAPRLRSAFKPEADANIRGAVISVLDKLADTPEGISYLIDNGFIDPLVDSLGPVSSGFSETLASCLVKVLSSAEGLRIFRDEKFQAKLTQLCGSERTKIQIYDIVVRLAGKSLDAFTAVSDSQWLQRIAKELESDDILFKLNIYQLLTNVVKPKPGIKWLVSSGTAANIHNTLSNPKPEDYLILSKVVAFVGEAVKHSDYHFEVLSELDWLTPLHKLLQHENDEVVLAVLWTLASIGSTKAGLEKLLMDNTGVVFDWLDFSTSSNFELRAGCLYGLAALFAAHTQPDEKQVKYLQKLYNRIFESARRGTAEGILRFLKEHLVELRYATLELFYSLVLYDFAIKDLINYPGMSEFLLNRNTESTKRGKEYKFGIIQRVTQHPDVRNLIPATVFYEFVEYIKKGPFFKKAEVAAMVEDMAM